MNQAPSVDNTSAPQSEPAPAASPVGADIRSVANRARVLIVFFGALILIVVARLVYWQVLPGRAAEPALAAAAPVEPSRGRVVDSNGVLLVTDDFLHEVYARPQLIPTSKFSTTVVISLTQVFEQPLEVVQEWLTSDKDLLVLTKSASFEQCNTIDKGLAHRDLVWCMPVRTRTYPQGTLAAHVLGFTNITRTGNYGIEASYDDWLRSDGAWPTREFPDQPAPLPENWKLYLPSPMGHDLALYLDAPLQYVVEQRLREAVAFYGAERGTIIVMDPRTGGVLALANYPSFDPNQYSDVAEDWWVNPAVSEIYEPGSVFKIITMAAALESGQITPDTIFQDDGSLVVGSRTIRNAQEKKYGRVTAREALAHSINVVSARIALDMGPEVFYGYVRRFGFGKLTEVDLRFESAGIVKERGDQNWSVFDQATNSFGQGISVTTLQMTNAVAAVANKGVLLQPRMVRGMVQDGQVRYLPPHIIGRPIRAETAQKLTDMMIYTVDKSAYAGLVPGFKLAGKTGTAEIPTEEGYTLNETITSFVGFLPAQDPQLVIMVKLDKAKRSRWAEQVVVPVFGEVAKDAVRILEIKPR